MCLCKLLITSGTIYHSADVCSPLLTTMYASGFAKQLGHSLSNYLKAKGAIKTIFTLLHRIPLIDVYSCRGLTLVSNLLLYTMTH